MKQLRVSLSASLLFFLACSPYLRAQNTVATQTVIELPLELVHDSIVVEANVNGRGPFSMLLDTGADPSIIDLKTASIAGVKLAANGQQGSGGGTGVNLAYQTVLSIVQLGPLTATDVDALGMDLSKLSSVLGRPIGGVLGYSLLKRRIVQIDYPNRKVRFYAIAPLISPSSSTTLPFRYRDDILASGATVNGKPVKTNIDTGSNSYFQLSPAAVHKLGLSRDVARAHASSSVGFNGESRNREGTVRNVSVGKISLNDPVVVFLGKGMGMDKEPWDLRIGNRFLKGFVMTLDFQNGRITLTRP